MNAFTNDGSFMEQFLKKQKLDSGGNDESSINTTTPDTNSPPVQTGYEGYGDGTQFNYESYYTDPNYAAYYAQYQQQYAAAAGVGGDYSQYQQQQQQGGDDQQQYSQQMMGRGGFGGGFRGRGRGRGGHFGGGSMGYGGGGYGQGGDGQDGSALIPTNVIWAGSTHPETTEKELRALFGPYGYIKDIKINPQRRYSFITFGDVEAAKQAQQQLDGTPLRGMALKLGFGKSTETPVNTSIDSQNPPCKNLWVGNVASTVTNEVLQEVFEKFGKVDNVRVLFGKHCAFVNFSQVESAINARNNLQGRNVHGSNLTINYRRESDGDGSDKPNFGGGFKEKKEYNRVNRDGGPMPAPPPASAKEQTIIDKLAEYVAKNGPRFESFTQEKQKNNPQFAFLKSGSPNHDYYRWKLWTIKNPDTHANDKSSNLSNLSNQQFQSNQQMDNNNSFMNQQPPPPPPQQQQQSTNNNNTPPPQVYLNEAQVQEFKEMLAKLSNTRGSITSCKSWIMANINHALEIISIITTTHQYNNLNFQQKLNILHVLNDSLHNSFNFRKNSPETLDDFANSIKDYLPYIVASTASEESKENQEKVLKVLTIWENQKIYSKSFIDSLKNAVNDAQ